MNTTATKTALEIVSVCRTYSGSYEICVEEGEKRRIVVIPPDVDQVQRVLDAVRAFSKMWDALGLGPDPAANRSPELLELLAAAHALDAPREQYSVHVYSDYCVVYERDGVHEVARCVGGDSGTQRRAEKIALLLNAQERKP